MFALTVVVSLGACARAKPSDSVAPEASFEIVVVTKPSPAAEQSAEGPTSNEAEAPAPSIATASPGGLPTVRVREPTVGPSYPPELIKTVMRRSKPGLRGCVDEPPDSSRGTLTFTIEVDGRVKEAAFKNGNAVIAPSRSQRCVLDAILAMRFVPPQSRLTVSYPLATDAAR